MSHIDYIMIERKSLDSRKIFKVKPRECFLAQCRVTVLDALLNMLVSER